MKTKINGILTLLLVFMVQMTFAQERTISGVVSDEMGPVADISVKVKGTTRGTVTDFDGNYAIKANTGDVLEFTHVSYATVTKTVGASSKIDVMVKETGESLEEVVVTSYGRKIAKRTTTYVTEKIDAKDLLTVQPTSAGSALAGKVAGLQINVTDNGVDPSTTILLRGMRSITQNNSPLILIDGSISTQGAFDQLNPSDIKSVNTLKGATASAVYGSRAANGVLIVETKKGGKDGKLTVGINSSFTSDVVAYTPTFQQEYGTGWQGSYESIENTNWGPRFDGSIRRIGPIYADGSYQTAPYAPANDNVKNFYNDGFTSQNTVSLSGGNEEGMFYVSAGYRKSTGLVPDDEYKKNTFRVNASRKLGKVELAVNTSYFFDDKSVVGTTIGSQDRALYWFILNTSNNIDLRRYKDWKNDFYASPNGWYNGYYQNPYWAIDTNRDTDKRNRFTGNVSASWDVKEWLDLSTRVGINRATGHGKEWRDAQIYDTSNMIVDASRPDKVSSWVQDSEFQSSQYTFDFLATGDFTYNEKFTLKPVIGFSSFSSDYRNSSIKANNLVIDNFYDISNGTGSLIGSVNEEKKRTFGVFGDFTFGYNNYLFINLSGRNDFTSTLDENNNSYFYPSVGVSAILSDMIPAIADNDFVNYVKFTASNTTSYNDVDPYKINEIYSQSGGFPYGNQNGFYLSGTAVSSEIRKEKLVSNEFGLNLELMQKRIRFNASYYTTTTSDLITEASTGPSAGSSILLTNLAQMDSKGIELGLGVDLVKKENGFNWNFDLNYTSNDSKIIKTDDAGNAINLGNRIYAVEGENFPQIKAPSYVRDPQGRIVINQSTGNPLVGGLKSLGKTTPDYILGLTNRFSYKNFTLGATLDYRTGHVYYSALADQMEFTGRSMESISANRQDFVFPNSSYETSPGSGVYVANTNIEVTEGKQNFWTGVYNDIKENYVKDATSLKIRELSLNYNVPTKYLDRIKLSTLSFGFIARNLMTWLPKENRFSDPEFNNKPNDNVNANAIGYGGFNQTPPTKSYGLSVNVQF